MSKIVTFDCFGTLIDQDLSEEIRHQLGGRLASLEIDIAQFLRDCHVMRFQACLGPYMPYEDLLRVTLEHAMVLHGIPYKDEDGDAMIEKHRTSRPFPEVANALREIKEAGHKIGLLTNTDDHLITDTIEFLEVEFDHVVTTEQLGAYKPLERAFLSGWQKMGASPENVIHVSRWWEYDIRPTHALGTKRRIWINRSNQVGSDMFAPYDELPDLGQLPDLLAQ